MSGYNSNLRTCTIRSSEKKHRLDGKLTMQPIAESLPLYLEIWGDLEMNVSYSPAIRYRLCDICSLATNMVILIRRFDLYLTGLRREALPGDTTAEQDPEAASTPLRRSNRIRGSPAQGSNLNLEGTDDSPGQQDPRRNSGVLSTVALTAIQEQDIPNTEAITGVETLPDAPADVGEDAEPMETRAAEVQEVGEGEGTQPMETGEAADSGGDDGEHPEPMETGEEAENGGGDGEDAEPKETEARSDSGGDDGEADEPKETEEAADSGDDDGDHLTGSDQEQEPEQEQEQQQQQQQEQPRRSEARRGPKTITPGLDKNFPFCDDRIEVPKDDYADNLYHVEDRWTMWVEPFSTGYGNKVWIRVWRNKKWLLLGSVVHVVDYTDSTHFADAQAGILDDADVRVCRLEVKLAAPFPEKYHAVLNMRLLVRDLCFPTYECFIWDRLPYWLFCPTLAADGINEILQTPWYTLKRHSSESVAEVLPCNTVLRFPGLAGKVRDNEQDAELRKFARFSPESPYFTMWDLKSRGELELRVVDALLKSVWELDITSEIWNTHYVGTL